MHLTAILSPFPVTEFRKISERTFCFVVEGRRYAAGYSLHDEKSLPGLSITADACILTDHDFAAFRVTKLSCRKFSLISNQPLDISIDRDHEIVEFRSKVQCKLSVSGLKENDSIPKTLNPGENHYQLSIPLPEIRKLQPASPKADNSHPHKIPALKCELLSKGRTTALARAGKSVLAGFADGRIL